MEPCPPMGFPVIVEQDFNSERPWVGAVLYQALPLLQFFVRNIGACKVKGRERESLGTRQPYGPQQGDIIIINTLQTSTESFHHLHSITWAVLYT